MKKIILLNLFTFCVIRVISQTGSVGIGTTTPNASAALEISSTDRGTLITRMTTSQRKNIQSPAAGLLVFDMDKMTIFMYDGSTWIPFLYSSKKDALPPKEVTASDGAINESFGSAVAISGDYAIIGAADEDQPNNFPPITNRGAAYIFIRTNGAWVQQAKLLASDGASNNHFGCSVGISGDYVIVGAYNADVLSNTTQGKAYIFSRSGTTWTQQFAGSAPDGASGDNFGYSVDISGDYAIVGSYNDDNGAAASQGSAYMLLRSGATWSVISKIVAADGAGGDWFGFSVSINGSYAIVGSPNDVVVANNNQGSAYIFKNTTGTWAQQMKLTASDGAVDDGFGYSVCIYNDYVVVGASFDDVGANIAQGSAYVFLRSGVTWSQQPKIVAPDGGSLHRFGARVSISGDYLVAGAPYATVGANTTQGAAYLFKREGTTWNFVRKITDEAGITNDYIGWSTALNGFNAAVGSQFANSSTGKILFLNVE